VTIASRTRFFGGDVAANSLADTGNQAPTNSPQTPRPICAPAQERSCWESDESIMFVFWVC
jgi:hypothetical protein